MNLLMLQFYHQKRKGDNTYWIVECLIWEEEKIVKDLRSGVVAHVCIPSTLELRQEEWGKVKASLGYRLSCA